MSPVIATPVKIAEMKKMAKNLEELIFLEQSKQLTLSCSTSPQLISGPMWIWLIPSKIILPDICFVHGACSFWHKETSVIYLNTCRMKIKISENLPSHSRKILHHTTRDHLSLCLLCCAKVPRPVSSWIIQLLAPVFTVYVAPCLQVRGRATVPEWC